MIDGRRHDGFEAAFLDEAHRKAGLRNEWSEHVTRRLTAGAVEYGDHGYLHRPILHLLRELAEEGQDLGAWAVLTAQRTYAEGLDDDRATALRMLLLEIAAYGPRVQALVDQARDVIG